MGLGIKAEISCSFCGTSRENSKRMIGNPVGNRHICGDCITQFGQQIETQPAGVIPMANLLSQPHFNGDMA